MAESRPRWSRDLLRFRFLGAVEGLVPEVLRELRENVLAVFTDLFVPTPPSRLGGIPRGAMWLPVRRGPALKIEDGYYIVWRHPAEPGAPRQDPSWAAEFGEEMPDRAAFRAALLAWAGRWNLRDEWVLDAALASLLAWLQAPYRETHWSGSGEAVITPADLEGLPKLEIRDQWMFEPWDKFASRVMVRLAEYKLKIEEYADAIGYDPPKAGTTLHHAEWLALYQCKKWSPHRIREWHRTVHQEGVVESAVTHAISVLATRIGLTKRRGKRVT